jgi:hypothetical protein
MLYIHIAYYLRPESYNVAFRLHSFLQEKKYGNTVMALYVSGRGGRLSECGRLLLTFEVLADFPEIW